MSESRQKIPEIKVDFSEYKFDLSRFLPTPIFLSIEPVRLPEMDFFTRYLSKEYTNPARQPGVERLPNDVWLNIFLALDVSSLVKLIVACKKLANLTHVRDISEKLNNAKQNRLLTRSYLNFLTTEDLQPSSLMIPQRLFGRVDLPRLEENQHNEEELYSSDVDIAENKGFILRRD